MRNGYIVVGPRLALGQRSVVLDILSWQCFTQNQHYNLRRTINPKPSLDIACVLVKLAEDARSGPACSVVDASETQETQMLCATDAYLILQIAPASS